MKLTRRFVAVALAIVATWSMLSITSCKDKFPTEIDTVRTSDTLHRTDTLHKTDTLHSTDTLHRVDTVHQHDTTIVQNGPDDLDDGWINSPSGTGSDLVFGNFGDGYTFPACYWNIVGASGTTLYSRDTCRTWATSFAGSGTLYGVSYADAFTGYAVGDDQTVYRTTDGGVSWTGSDFSQYSGYKLRSVCFIDKNIGFIGTANWAQNPLPGHDGEIWRTSDAGATWTRVWSGSGTGSIYGITFSNSTHGIASGKFGLVLVTNDAGLSWTPGNSGMSGFIQHISWITGSTFVGVSYGNSNNWPNDGSQSTIIRSDDGGVTWHSIYSGGNFDAIASDHHNTLFAAGYNGQIAESLDNGATWNVDVVQPNTRWLDVKYAQNGGGVHTSRVVLMGTGGAIEYRDH